MTILEAGRLLRTGQISCVELVEESLEKIRAGEHLNAFLTVTAEQALAHARRLDRELREGTDRGPLHGIPVAYKDLIYTRGVRTTNGSKVFADFVPAYSATVVDRMEAAGAISMGKLNMHEIAYGITSNNPHFGAVRNPHNPERIPGGSSGGSGAAVASGMVFCGMGSDTGGSIRIPAAYCGVVGLKGTFGLVSRYGTFPLGLTLDHIGPLTRTVADASLVLKAIAGRDPNDEATVERPADGSALSMSECRIGWPRNFFCERLDPEVLRACEVMLDRARQGGARIVPVTVPDPVALNAIARVTLLCEASSVMMRYLDRRADFGADVLALLDQGRTLPATDYINAQRVRRVMQRDWMKLFRDVDVILTPATPIAAPAIGQATVQIGGQEEDTRLASTRLVRGVNALGLPAIAVPAGRNSEGLPLSVQLIGRAWAERVMIACASGLETPVN